MGFQYLRETQALSFACVYIIRCIAVWKEIAFVVKISKNQTYKPTQGQNNK